MPVSVTAFNTEMIAEKQITELRDLTRSAPGLVFTQSGSGPNINITLRGQTKSTVGAGLPSVITYFNEVPLPSYGSSLPTYDVSSLQVLKGPQAPISDGIRPGARCSFIPIRRPMTLAAMAA